MSDRIPITPETRVAALLESYPELEEVLVGLAPPFAKLRNPVLRRTIARVTSLEKAAAVAGVPLREMLVTLRRAAGIAEAGDLPGGEEASSGPESTELPEWVDRARVRWTLDADAMLESGAHPMVEVLQRAAALEVGELGVVSASFRPAPLLELLGQRGFRTAVTSTDSGTFDVFVGRS